MEEILHKPVLTSRLNLAFQDTLNWPGMVDGILGGGMLKGTW